MQGVAHCPWTVLFHMPSTLCKRVWYEAINQGSYMSWKTWKNVFVMECHGNVMEFYFSGKGMEMSWNFTKILQKSMFLQIP